MPRTTPDYSKTILYKIQHVTMENLVYVGATTDFKNRKTAHKSQSERYNENTKGRTVLYKAIREHGGWNNFIMIEIKKFPCKDKRESDAEEFRLIQELKATLNFQHRLSRQ